MSSWITSASFARRGGNLSLKNGTLTSEFDRTKYTKIVISNFGNFVLAPAEVNRYREDVIQSRQSLFSISGVYIDSRIIEPNNDGSFTVYAHGRLSQKVSTENCTAAGMTCSSGNGTNTACSKGKCVSGRIDRVPEIKSDGSIRVSPNKWRYTSGTESYYVIQENGVIKLRNNKSGTSRHSKIYVPPNTYLSGEDFIKKLFKNFSYLILIGGEDSKDKFISDGIKKSSYYNPSGLPVEQYIYEDINSLGDPWYSLAADEIAESRNSYPTDDKRFLEDVYGRLSILFSKAIQVTSSSLSQAKVGYYRSELARPIYSRLPGTSGAYSSIDNEETVAKWVVAGADELLSESKSKIGNFYRDYLDPDTCYPLSLDWLAQHIGMFGALWDKNWPADVKRVMIKNMFGWWDSEVDGINQKSKILQEFPFSTSVLWSESEDSKSIDYGELEKFEISEDDNSISMLGKYKSYSVNTDEETGVSTLSFEYTNEVRFSPEDWNGLIESKGGILSIMFLISVFDLKAHIPEELEVIDLEKGHLKPKSGLRSLEISSPPLLPYKQEMCQCGDYEDLRVNNFKNQMVVGYSRVNELENTRNIIFRVPYYYNRNGRSWSKVEYISKYWIPVNLNSRVQYPYLSADLWTVGDAFFEPNYEIV